MVKGQFSGLAIVIFLDVYINVNVRDLVMEQNVLSGFCQQSEPDFNLSEGIKQRHNFNLRFKIIQHGEVMECVFNKFLSNTSCFARLLLALLLLQHFTWRWGIHFP